MTGYVLMFFFVAAFFSWLFYDSFIPLIAAVPLSIPFVRKVKKIKAAKRNEEMTEEFIRALTSISASLSAGLSVENAFVRAIPDMEKLYGRGSVIVRELEAVNWAVRSGRSIIDAVSELAAKWKIREMIDFSVVFSTAVRNGGDLTTVISSCTRIMEDRLLAEAEAKVMIRAKQYEQRVMCAIPPAILAYLRLSSGSFTGVLYHDLLGIIIMTGSLALYVAAILLSERIGDIRV